MSQKPYGRAPVALTGSPLCGLGNAHEVAVGVDEDRRVVKEHSKYTHVHYSDLGAEVNSFLATFEIGGRRRAERGVQESQKRRERHEEKAAEQNAGNRSW